jgi:hypothetical protein
MPRRSAHECGLKIYEAQERNTTASKPLAFGNVGFWTRESVKVFEDSGA